MVTVKLDSYDLTHRTGRGEVTVTLFDGYPSEVPPTLPGLVAWANGLLESVPVEFRERVYWSFNSGYDGDPDELEVRWSRPETDAEWQHRIQGYIDAAVIAAVTAEQQERALLRKLHEKYGDPPK